jgi:hypothetical protein
MSTITNEQLFDLLESLRLQVRKLNEQTQWPIGASKMPGFERLSIPAALKISDSGKIISDVFDTTNYDYFYPIVSDSAGSASVLFAYGAQQTLVVETQIGNVWVPYVSLTPFQSMNLSGIVADEQGLAWLTPLSSFAPFLVNGSPINTCSIEGGQPAMPLGIGNCRFAITTNQALPINNLKFYVIGRINK